MTCIYYDYYYQYLIVINSTVKNSLVGQNFKLRNSLFMFRKLENVNVLFKVKKMQD